MTHSFITLKAVLLAVVVSAVVFVPIAVCEDFKLGMIGLDTSHVVAFTKVLNTPDDPNHVPGGKVIAAYKGGSGDLPSSYERVDGYTQQLQDEYGVKIVDSIEELCDMVDCVLLMSVDGRPHLEQVKPVFKAGKRVFIDKPMAGSLADVLEIFRLSEESGVPCFSSSSYRYYDSMVELKKQNIGELRGAISFGPCHLEEHHPDLFWYGVHPTEALFTIMGTGCESVVRTNTESTDVVTGVWSGGRVGTLRGLRNASTPHKVIVFGTEAVAEQKEGSSDYAPLVVQIIEFFRTGVPPIQPQETIEMFAFMEAADESKRLGGAPVNVQEYIEKVRKAGSGK
jgi:predicted dehydrogenase